MIDIHCHAIFDVDDGADSLESSIKMIKTAKDVGINKICFTPHYMEDGYKTSKQELFEKMNIIKKELSKNNIDMEVSLGEEVFVFPALDKKFDEIICLNNSKYILIEIPLMEEINYLDDVIYRLISAGKVPILAHPERYLLTSRNINFISNLLDKGVLLQLNINSIIGFYGNEAKSLAIKLLKANAYSFAGSDAHSPRAYFAIEESSKAIKKIIGEEEFFIITETNPQKVLNNEDISPRKVTFNNKKECFFKNLFKRED